ncbi:MAG: glycosyltransferase family 9 protein [Pseudobdellovibrionaceae bacterium]
MFQTQCRFFNGYKPCGKNSNCSADCPSFERVNQSVLLIHLGALGAVVRSTALLQKIKEKYPQSLITWVTDAPAQQLLKNHPLVDRVLTTGSEDLLQLSALEFDLAFVVDKSLKATGVLKSTKAKQVYGFRAEARTGAILPATPAATELWSLGLNDEKKFFQNQKTEIQLICEALELGPMPLPAYDLPLSDLEARLCSQRKKQWSLNFRQPVIGINTGCANVIPAKKLTVEYQRRMIQAFLDSGFENLVLLGGPEDEIRNQQIGQGLPIFQSSTGLGLRDGLVSVAACDLVVTGDSLGMHMAISQSKFVIAWFGPTCAQEIELYGKGVKIQSQAACGPCWKRSCDKAQMCYDQVDLGSILQAIFQGTEDWCRQNEFSLFKPLF